jgi:hypothetical protein
MVQPLLQAALNCALGPGYWVSRDPALTCHKTCACLV